MLAEMASESTARPSARGIEPIRRSSSKLLTTGMLRCSLASRTGSASSNFCPGQSRAGGGRMTSAAMTALNSRPAPRYSFKSCRATDPERGGPARPPPAGNYSSCPGSGSAISGRGGVLAHRRHGRAHQIADGLLGRRAQARAFHLQTAQAQRLGVNGIGMEAAGDEDRNGAPQHERRHERIIERDFQDHHDGQQRRTGRGGKDAAHSHQRKNPHRHVFRRQARHVCRPMPRMLPSPAPRNKVGVITPPTAPGPDGDDGGEQFGQKNADQGRLRRRMLHDAVGDDVAVAPDFREGEGHRSHQQAAHRHAHRQLFDSLKNSALERNSLRKTAPSTPAKTPSTTNQGNCEMRVKS